jgi:hypothetical protein
MSNPDPAGTSDLPQNLKNFQNYFEVSAKAGALVVAFLYILGLLISNIHLMQLGIADFTDLRARYILVGLLFLLYAGCLGLIVASIAGPLFLSGSIWSRILRGIAATFVTVIFASLFAGYLIPGGRTWAPVWEQKITSDCQLSAPLRQMSEHVFAVFGHPSILTVLIGTILMAVFYRFPQAIRIIMPERVVYSGMALLNMLLLVAGYSVFIFPNFRYNLGGGYPQFVELQVEREASTRFAALGVKVSSVDSLSSTAGPIALWHQSDEFLFGTPVSDQGSSTGLIGIPVEDVQGMKFIEIIARFRSGGAIRKLLSSDDDYMKQCTGT